MLKWRIFKEKLPDHFNPKWVVWDEYNGEFLFDSGDQALAFVNRELISRFLAKSLSVHQERVRRD